MLVLSALLVVCRGHAEPAALLPLTYFHFGLQHLAE